jgi:hypothetical protein
MSPQRAAAIGAAAAVSAGALVMLGALIAAPGSWLTGYVSEVAAPGMPTATAYRWGFAAVSAGVALLALALRSPAPQSPAAGPAFRGGGSARAWLGWLGARAAGLIPPLLLAAAALSATSTAVTCSRGCPLPPYEPTTPRDMVHGGASVVGLVLLAGVMVLVSLSEAHRAAQRRLAAVSAAVIVPLGATLALSMLVVGRTGAGALLERLILAVAVSWLTGAALLATSTTPASAGTPATTNRTPLPAGERPAPGRARV